MVYNENLYFLLCSWTNLILWKFFIPEIWVKNGSKCFQPNRLQDFLINHISKTNQWNSLIFCMLIQLHKLNVDKKNWVDIVKIGSGHLKNGSKMGQKQFFWTYLKIWALIFNELFAAFQEYCHIWKKICFRDMVQKWPKNGIFKFFEKHLSLIFA